MVNHAKFLGRGFVGYAAEISRSRRLILDLTRREFRSRYLGNAFGLVWAFVQPAVLMLVYWWVFTHVMPGPKFNNVPFVVWLFAGLVPWFMMSDLMVTGSSVILDNRFLVKKVVFRVSLLPVVRLLTFLPVHLFFVFVLTLLFWGYGYTPGLYTLQVFYYLGAMMVLGLAWSLLTSAIVPFVRDLWQLILVILQVLFWATPLVWNVGPPTPGLSMFSTATMKGTHSNLLKSLLQLNPLYYIVQGYRDSMIDHVPFWRHPLVGAYYWCFTAVVLVVGAMVFNRLRTQFADVL